jgi:hypothetical protein
MNHASRAARVVDRVPVLEDFVASLSVFRVMSLSCARTSTHNVYIFLEYR